eukprot:12779980-Prorocentrum_lima.AAC.1
MMGAIFKADDPNLLGQLELSWRQYLSRMIKHCENIIVPGLVVPGGYQSLPDNVSIMAMLQENFGLLSCFIPEEVGVFILE